LTVLTAEVIGIPEVVSTPLLSRRLTFVADRTFEIIPIIAFTLDPFTISIDYVYDVVNRKFHNTLLYYG
jgi:hypothetical protein